MNSDTSGGEAPARPKPWNNPAVRAVVFQALVLALVLGFGVFLVHNTISNMERRGIASGFGFLSSPAGFGIIQTLVEYDEKSSYGRAFVVGLLNTLLVAGLGIVLATLLGFAVGIARLSRNWLIARLATIYVEVIRNVPLLLQLFFWYFAVLRTLPTPRQSIVIANSLFLNLRGFYVPQPIFGAGAWIVPAAVAVAVGAVICTARFARRRFERTGAHFPTFWVSLGLLLGVPLAVAALAGFPIRLEYPKLEGFNFVDGMVLYPELVALTVGLTIYTASFIAEIVRAGILAVSHGQTEAAYSLGLRRGPTLRLIVIPQALRVIIPPLTSQYLNVTKNSSLGVAIAYPDLVSVFAGTVLNQTGQAVEVIGITMAVYLSISLLIAMFMNWFNRRMALVER